MREIKVAGKNIGNGHPTYMIAEAGLNHNGDVKLARDLIAAASECGADAVKFQTFDTDEFIAHDSPYYDIFKNSELSSDEFAELKAYAAQLGILFFSTPFDFRSADFLSELDVELFKIASCDLTNLPILRHVARMGKPILLSTGMGTIAETFAAIDAVKGEGNEQIALFHCIAHYPAKPEEMNLRAIPYMKSVFNCPVGLSDHTLGIDIPNASIAVGANIIEKHFTLDKKLPGPDHQLSATPDEFRKMVETARLIEVALGSNEKIIPESAEHRALIRRSLTARKDIARGTIITPDLVAIKRPGDGLAPDLFDFIIGRKTKTDMKRDQQFSLEKLE